MWVPHSGRLDQSTDRQAVFCPYGKHPLIAWRRVSGPRHQQKEAGDGEGAAPVPSLLTQFVDFIVFAYRLSVQDCSGVKWLATRFTVGLTVSSRRPTSSVQE